MIPVTEADAITELKKLVDLNSMLAREFKNLSEDRGYSPKDRDASKSLADLCEGQLVVLNDVIAGLATIAISKKPSEAASIISQLTK